MSLENLPDIEGTDAAWVPGVDEWYFSWTCPECGCWNRDPEGPVTCSFFEETYYCKYSGILSGSVPSKLVAKTLAENHLLRDVVEVKVLISAIEALGDK